MEFEQCILMKYLRFKKLKIFDIHHEFILTFGEKVCTFASVKHWIHELKTWRIILADEDRSERLSTDDIGMPILEILGKISFSSV
jgi:hypothetical protein